MSYTNEPRSCFLSAAVVVFLVHLFLATPHLLYGGGAGPGHEVANHVAPSP